MNKESIITKILKTMHDNGISEKNLREYRLQHPDFWPTAQDDFLDLAPENFDLLCRVDNRLRCLPFPEGKNLNPIGIFPFAFASDHTFYLELKKNEEETLRKQCREYYIPTYELWQELSYIRPSLNRCFEEIGVSPLQGCYFSKAPKNHIIQHANWIISFSNESPDLLSDYYDYSQKAKLRCVEKM